jgi:hypothetical protein
MNNLIREFNDFNEIEEIRNDIDNYINNVHTATEIKNFGRECAERIKNLPDGNDKEQIKSYLLDNVKRFPIRKFPYHRNPNNDIYVINPGAF